MLTLALAIVAADFRPRFGISGEQWQAGIVVLLGITFAWLVISIPSFFRSPSIEDVLVEIVGNARLSRERRAVFIVKALSKQNITKFLVYRDPIWNAYFLPHASLGDGEIDERVKQSLERNIADYVGVKPERVQAQYLNGADLRSLKHSDFHMQDTTYHFQFFHVSISCILPIANERTPKFAGRDLAWMSTEEMEADINTARKNFDVTRHIRDRFDLFFNSLPNSIDARVP